MSRYRSFTEYISRKFEDVFWNAAEKHLHDYFDSMDIELYKIHKAGEPEISDVTVEHVWTYDLPGMSIKFDVALSMTFAIPEADYHYDNYEEKTKWLMVQCQGDLDKRLNDLC